LYISGTVIAVLLIYQYFTGASFLGIEPQITENYLRTIGISQNINNVALNLTIVLPLGFFLYEEKGHFLHKVAVIISMLIILSAILTTYSRGAMIALLVLSIYKILTTGRIHRKISLISIGILSLCLLSLILPAESFLNRLMDIPKFLRLFSSNWSTTYLSREFGSIWGRYQAYIAGLRMFIQNPLLGVGHNNFANSVPFYSQHLIHNISSHNMYICIFAETGIFGGLSFLRIWYLTLSNLNLSLFKETKDRFFLNVKIGLIGYLTGAFFLTAQYYELAWLYIAFSIAGYELYYLKESKEDNE
jgi:O-antigen ligase